MRLAAQRVPGVGAVLHFAAENFANCKGGKNTNPKEENTKGAYYEKKRID